MPVLISDLVKSKRNSPASQISVLKTSPSSNNGTSSRFITIYPALNQGGRAQR
jgi:hypothetical protein